ncbi:MAG: zinc ribbon domain-containing protein [Blastocatellia bacterium]
MFCPTCGFEYTHKTNFCKSCGGNLGTTVVSEIPQAEKLPRPKIVLMFWAIAAFGITGLLADFIAYYNLAEQGLRGDALTIPFVMGLLFTGGVVGFLAWQLARIVAAYQRAGQNVVIEKHYIREAPPAQIGAPTDQIPRAVERPSVVEHTTRQMASVHREPNPR